MPFNSFLNYPMSWKPERSRLKRPVYLSLAEQLEKDMVARSIDAYVAAGQIGAEKAQ